MEIRIIQKPIDKKELSIMAQDQFGDLIKATVDIKQELIALGGELHADEEALLVEKGSNNENLWGINLYPRIEGDAWIEFDSMINIKPSFGNNSRNIEDIEIQSKIRKIIDKLIID